jgi:hypothetical protein
VHDEGGFNDLREEVVTPESTAWFPLEGYTPVREGWYEVQLVSGETAFAKFDAQGWTEKPMLVFTHWRGLCSDPGSADEAKNISAEVTAAEGVRAVWDAFFPRSGPEQHKSLDAEHAKRH